MIGSLEPKTSQGHVIRRSNANFRCLKLYYIEQYQKILIKIVRRKTLFSFFFQNQTLNYLILISISIGNPPSDYKKIASRKSRAKVVEQSGSPAELGTSLN